MRSPSLPFSALPRLLLLPALLVAGMATAAGPTTQQVDSAISAAHTTVDDAADGARSLQGEASGAQASRASAGTSASRAASSAAGTDAGDAADEPPPLNQGGQTPDARTILEQRRRQAQAALNRKDPARALAMAEQALQQAPGDARLRFLKGLALFQLKLLPDAEREFSSLIEEYPELPEPYNNLAVVRAAQGRLEGARDALEEAIRAVPDYVVAYQNLGDLYLQLAAQRWRQAEKLAPSPARAVRLKALDALVEPATATSGDSH